MSTPTPERTTTTPAEGVTIHHGDCLDVLRAMPAESVHAIVTDPPYGLGFMGRAWDALPPGAEWAAECLRVLKPGGHLLAFGGTRTWHRLAVAVEDAGFEVRDSLAWLYGSGFPKSMDVSKAIDKGSGANRARQLEFTAWMRSTGITAATIREATGTDMASHYLTNGSQPAIATAEQFDLLRPHLPEVPERIERLVAERTGIEWSDYVKREVLEVRHAADRRRDGTVIGLGHSGAADVTAAHSDAARQWEGWGTALKPGFEPIVMARKPLTGTVAANVLEHGTGALNIDACRIEATDKAKFPEGVVSATERVFGSGRGMHGDRPRGGDKCPSGRWPANVMLDESQAAALDRQSGVLANAGNKPGSRRTGRADGDAHERTSQVPTYPGGPSVVYDDKGGASRFFYVAKAGRRERPEVDGVKHPTVKPLALMRQLCRLVTPPGGVILEPFAGSGTTVEAAMLEGFDVVGIEREAEYLPLIGARVQRALEARAREARETEVRLF